MRNLWDIWMSLIIELRPAFSREITFHWFVTAVMGMTVRNDFLGVSSLLRALGLGKESYHPLLNLFRSEAVKVSSLVRLWCAVCLEKLPLLMVNGLAVLVVDGVKNPKEGRKMPGVKSQHQESQNNSKPKYIMGHLCQVVSVLAQGFGSVFAVPLDCRIHSGVIFSNRDRRTLYDKLLNMIYDLKPEMNFYLVADAYYAVRKMINRLRDGDYLLTRVKNNAVAYEKPVEEKNSKRRGRKKKYGQKVRLKDLFSLPMREADSPVYKECGVKIAYYSIDLLWRPVGRLIRFILVKHPSRGKMILMTTDLNLDPLTAVMLYGYRFKIEVSFKQLIHTIGACSYRFWMKAMTPVKKGAGDQYLHKKTKKYRRKVREKIAAYELHLRIGLISQGIMQYISLSAPSMVWNSFGGFMRTMNTNSAPSEWVVAEALKSTLPEFYESTDSWLAFMKFRRQKNTSRKSAHLRFAA